MKSSKTTSITRRSLRNTPNGSKSASSKGNKASAYQTKSATKVKTKDVKGSQKAPPAKSVSQVSKRKRETEEKAEESSGGDPASPSSNADQDESLAKLKVRRLRRPRKKKENQLTEEVSWQTLDDFNNGKASDECKKKASNSDKGKDRRKQSLVERDIPCAVMVRSKPQATSHQEDDSDCEVLDGADNGTGNESTFKNVEPLHMDIDDAQSEAGSNFCEIIEEGSSLLDFKKLHALARRVTLPSSIWACHIDPRSHFVSFTRFNPDFSESGSNLVDRAVVFKGCMKPIVFCNGETTSLPEEINTFETLTDVAQALQHLNAMILP